MAFKMKGSAMYGKGNQSNYGKPSIAKDYDVNKGSHGHPHEAALKKYDAPLKEHAKGHVTDEDGKTTQINTVNEGRENERGQTQNELLDSRKKKEKTYYDKVTDFQKKNTLTEENQKKANQKLKMLNDLTTSSMDSIQGVNIKLDAEDAKKKKLSDDEFDAL
tara:strand:+ start:76 stop:561 length:486 start_codon:yes stop_codon:yes gene_type:complete